MYSYQDITLEEEELIHLDYDYYLYLICVQGKEVGRITFRLGSDEMFELDGHIGYEIEEEYRGHHYSYQACMALIPKIKEYYDHILITCDPDNLSSKRIIERLKATYLRNKNIPKRLQDYYPGSTSKDIYQWNL